MSRSDPRSMLASIEIGGRRYVHARGTLSGHGADGTSRIRRSRTNVVVTFFAGDGQPFGYAAMERGHVRGWFGTAWQTDEGIRYLHAATHGTEVALGVVGMGYTDDGILAAQVVRGAMKATERVSVRVAA